MGHIWKRLEHTYQPKPLGNGVYHWLWSQLQSHRSCHRRKAVNISEKFSKNVAVNLQRRCSFSSHRFDQRMLMYPLRACSVGVVFRISKSSLCRAVAFVIYCLSPGSQSEINITVISNDHFSENFLHYGLPLITSFGTVMPAASSVGSTS